MFEWYKQTSELGKSHFKWLYRSINNKSYSFYITFSCDHEQAITHTLEHNCLKDQPVICIPWDGTEVHLYYKTNWAAN